MALASFAARPRAVLGGRRALSVRAEKNWAKEAGGTVVTTDMVKTERYIAMNRFKVKQGAGAKFEQRWATRKSRLAVLDGFRFFTLLRRVPRKEGEDIPKGEVVVAFTTSARAAPRCAARLSSWCVVHSFRSCSASQPAHRTLAMHEPATALRCYCTAELCGAPSAAVPGQGLGQFDFRNPRRSISVPY